jgi:hypothetical protein
MRTKFWLESLKGRYHSKGPDIHRWEDKVEMNIKEIGFGDLDWIYLAQERNRWLALVSTVICLNS